MEQFSVINKRPSNHRGRQPDTALNRALLQSLKGGAVRIPLKKRKPKSLTTALYMRAGRLGYTAHIVTDGEALIAWLGKKRKKSWRRRAS